MKSKVLLTMGELFLFLQLGDDFMTATTIRIDVAEGKKILSTIGESAFNSQEAIDFVKNN